MEEAQRLADRVAIIAAGRVVARGTPEDLGDRDNQPTTITYRGPQGEVTLSTREPVRELNRLTSQALADGFDLEGLEVRRPSLEDVYLELTHEGEPG
jgi:ABC-2 type transport system ATP-binding protein